MFICQQSLVEMTAILSCLNIFLLFHFPETKFSLKEIILKDLTLIAMLAVLRDLSLNCVQ